MLLYATIESERASKGQGGEYLDINIKDERGVTFCLLKVRKEQGKFYPTIYHYSHGEMIEDRKIDNIEKAKS